MAILLDKNSRLLVQGITGTQGSLHTRACKEYGTQVVAGVTPGKGGQSFEGIPVFNSVAVAVKNTQANVSMVFVPPPFAADAIIEAAYAQIPLIICITEGIPVSDMMCVSAYLKNKPTRLIGPNCPGIITPEQAKVGIMPSYIHKAGPIGVISRSGTLTYETVWQLTQLGLGQSTCIGIGGDSIQGTNFVDCLKLFQLDPDTKGIVLIGEIGGNAEEEAAEYIRNNITKPSITKPSITKPSITKPSITKPIVAFIAGQTAPIGRRMGHAGAIVAGGKGTADEKIKALQAAGVHIAPTPDVIGQTMFAAMKKIIN